MNRRTVVPPVATLRRMAAAGLIELHADTGKKVVHWSGSMVTAYYVESARAEPFEFEGRQYRLKYFDGCFCPFVVDVGLAEDAGLNLDGTLIA